MVPLPGMNSNGRHKAKATQTATKLLLLTTTLSYSAQTASLCSQSVISDISFAMVTRSYLLTLMCQTHQVAWRPVVVISCLSYTAGL